LVAWLATKTDKSTIRRLVRVDWDTVGRIITRVCADELDRPGAPSLSRKLSPLRLRISARLRGKGADRWSSPPELQRW
jgi:hypothetical protein